MSLLHIVAITYVPKPLFMFISAMQWCYLNHMRNCDMLNVGECVYDLTKALYIIVSFLLTYFRRFV